MAFFAPPPSISTTLFTRLPDRFRKPRPTAWAKANRGGQEIDSFLEGPCFDRAGRLYVTDIPYGRVFRISPDGEWEQVSEYDGWPNGLKIHKDGRIFITCYKRGLMLLDGDSGAVTPFLETAGSEGFKGVNDLTFGCNGDLYFTDQGQTGLHDPTGRVYRLTASGQLTCLIDTVPSPNGVVIDTAMTSLFVAVTRAQQIWRIPLTTGGIVSKVGVFAQLHGGMGGPDGIALDSDGCLIVAHTGFGSIWRLSPVAEPLLRVTSCAGFSTTNIAYGGPDHKTLFITESHSGSILRADMPAPGQRLYSHTD
jgi:gluconolactonase